MLEVISGRGWLGVTMVRFCGRVVILGCTWWWLQVCRCRGWSLTLSRAGVSGGRLVSLVL